MLLFYVAGVVLAPVCAYLFLRALDWIVAKQRRLLQKTRRTPQRCKVPRFQEGQADLVKRDGPKVERICIGGNKRSGRTSRSAMAQRERETEEDRERDIQSDKERLKGEIGSLKVEIRSIGHGKVRDGLMSQLGAKELELRAVLFESSDPKDQRAAMGDMSGQWTPEKAALIKQRIGAGQAGGARRGGRKGAVSQAAMDLEKVVSARVAEQIGSLGEGPIVEEIHPDGTATVVE